MEYWLDQNGIHKIVPHAHSWNFKDIQYYGVDPGLQGREKHGRELSKAEYIANKEGEMMDNKFTSLQELIDSIEMGLDIECSIYGTDYYIGWSEDKRIIAECPNDEGVKFNSLNEMLEYKIKGIPLRNIWEHIVIDRM